MKVVIVILLASMVLQPSYVWAAARITSIDFKSKNGTTVIEITSDTPLSYDKQDNLSDNQIIVDLKDAKLAKGASRKLDTSSFNSKVTLVSPYQVNDQGE